MKGFLPTRSSYITTPSEYMSLWKFNSLFWICSGDM